MLQQIVRVLVHAICAGAFKFIRDHYSVVTAVSGIILIVMGVMIFTNEITRLNNDAQNFLGSLGLDFIYNL